MTAAPLLQIPDAWESERICPICEIHMDAGRTAKTCGKKACADELRRESNQRRFVGLTREQRQERMAHGHYDRCGAAFKRKWAEMPPSEREARITHMTVAKGQTPQVEINRRMREGWRRKLGPRPTKLCQLCGAKFEHQGHREHGWKARKFCSRRCGALSRWKNHQVKTNGHGRYVSPRYTAVYQRNWRAEHLGEYREYAKNWMKQRRANLKLDEFLARLYEALRMTEPMTREAFL